MDRDLGSIVLKLNIEKTLLIQWAQQSGLTSAIDNEHDQLDGVDDIALALRILTEIKTLLGDGERLETQNMERKSFSLTLSSRPNVYVLAGGRYMVSGRQKLENLSADPRMVLPEGFRGELPSLSPGVLERVLLFLIYLNRVPFNVDSPSIKDLQSCITELGRSRSDEVGASLTRLSLGGSSKAHGRGLPLRWLQ